ncbi:MAG: cytochrome c biogenesis protein CcdA [Chloroflexi bacterium]|nr:cytochrome c biogenesis protein CcdA [Chloroflexota bacterium]
MIRKISFRLMITAAIISGAILILILTSGANVNASAFAGTSMFALMPAAFFAGVLSFLSPCTLPILPAYFAFSMQARKGNVTLTTLVFVCGLATTLTLLGASATALGQLFSKNLQTITLIGGGAIILFGIMSLFGKGFSGFQLGARPEANLIGSYFYGATFALGWSACIGPILGTIFTLLATQGVTIVQWAVLMFAYSLGLGLPLILIATFFSRLGNGTTFWGWIRGKGFTLFGFDFHTTNVISGALLIGMGALLASGQLSEITSAAAGSSISLWVIETEENLRTVFGLK